MSDEIEELRRQLACKEAAIKNLKKWRKAVADQLALKARSKPNGACIVILDLQNKVRDLEQKENRIRAALSGWLRSR